MKKLVKKLVKAPVKAPATEPVADKVEIAVDAVFVDSAEAIAVTDFSSAADDTESSVDGGPHAPADAPKGAEPAYTVPVEPVKEVERPVKFQIGMEPNPSLADMNRAASQQFAQRRDKNYAEAQKALARVFGKRVYR